VSYHFYCDPITVFIENLGSLKKSAYGSLWPLAAWFISRTLFSGTRHESGDQSGEPGSLQLFINLKFEFFEQNFHLVLFPHKEHYLQIMRDVMTNSLYEARLQGIMVVVFIILDWILF